MSEDPIKTNLLALVAEALNDRLGQDRVQSLMEALHLFEHDGGTEGLVELAKSKGMSPRVQRRALELLFSPPPNVTGWSPQPEAYDLAASFVSGDNAEMQRSAIEVLVEKVTDTAKIPAQLQHLINDLAVGSPDPRTRKAAQEFIILMLENDTASVSTTRNALRVCLTEPDTIQRLQCGEQVTQSLPRAVERHHGDFAEDDWGLLAKAGRELGVLPGKPKGPSFWWWPSIKSRREMRSDLGVIGFFLPGIAALLMALALSFILTRDAQLNLTLPLYYTMISTIAGSILGVLCVLIFPPISLFSHRRHGSLLQSVLWVGLMAAFAYVAVLLMSFYTEDRLNPVNQGFWESFAVLTIALALVRPVTLAIYRLGGRTQRRRIVTILCGIVVPLGVLATGVGLGLEDGRTLELQTLFIGGPMVAAAATVFAMLDTYRPDLVAVQASKGGPYVASGAILAGVAAIMVVIFDFVDGPGGTAQTANLARERLVHLGTNFSFDVPVRETIRFESQSNAAMTADIQASNGQSLTLNVTQSETQPLAPDVYDVCLRSRAEICDTQADIKPLAAWRLLLERVDMRLEGRPTDTDKSIPTEFERITITREMTGEDGDALEEFIALEERAVLSSIEEENDLGSDAVHDLDMDENAQYFLATRDAVIGGGSDSLRILRGSLVVRSIQDNSPRLTLVDGLALRDHPHFSLLYADLAIGDFVELEEVDGTTLETVAGYLEIARNEQQHVRLTNPTLQLAIRHGLEHSGGLNPDRIVRGQHFLSTAQSEQAGAGVFEVLSVLPSAEAGGPPVLLSRLKSGWSFVPSPTFCYRFPSDNALLAIDPNGVTDSLRAALETEAEQRGGASFLLDRAPLERQINALHCPTFAAPEASDEIKINEDYALADEWDDKQFLRVETPAPMFFRGRFADGFIDSYELFPNDEGIAEFSIRDPEGDLVAICFLESFEDAGCSSFDAMALEEMIPLPDPEDGNILRFTTTSPAVDAEIFARFETAFQTGQATPQDATFGIALRPIALAQDTSKLSVSSGSGDELQQPEIGIGSLIELDEDKATVVLALSGRTSDALPASGEVDLYAGDIMYLDSVKAAENFELVLEYMRATARATETALPGGRDVEAFFDSISVPILPRDKVVRIDAPSLDLEALKLESGTSFEVFAIAQDGQPGLLQSTLNARTDVHTLSYPASPDVSAHYFCIATPGNRQPCEVLTGFGSAVLAKPASGQPLTMQETRENEAINTSVGQIMLNTPYSLDLWTESNIVSVLSDFDIVIKAYYEDGIDRGVIDDDLLGAPDYGEEFTTERMIGFCAIAYDTDWDTSCPEMMSPDAQSVLPIEGSSAVNLVEIVQDVTDSLTMGRILSLGDDWRRAGFQQIRADAPFELVVTFEGPVTEVIEARLFAGSYIANLSWPNGSAPTALCGRVDQTDPSCDILLDEPMAFELKDQSMFFVQSGPLSAN